MKQLISDQMGSHGVQANCQIHKLSEKMKRSMLVVTVLGVMLLIGAAEQVHGQGGSLSGKVTDQQSGQVLSGVKVSIPSLGVSAYTDRDGRYVFRSLSGGTYELEVSSLGYKSQQVSVAVESGQSAEAAVALQGEYAGGDRIFGTRTRAEQVRVQNRHRNPMQVSTAIGTEHRNRFGDYTVRDALIRVPGIQVGSNREINLRGVGRNAYNVTLDGQRMATTGLGDRSVDLGMFSTDLIDDIEVIRVVSPDMDADALSGVVNLTTYQPVGGPRRLEVHMGGGANSEYFGFTGPDQRASLRYYETVAENLALSGVLSYHQLSHSREGLGIVYDVADFGDGPEDVLENISPSLQNDTRQAIGGQLQLTYEPTQRSTYHISGLINSENRIITRHTDSFSANGDWISPDTTGLIGNQGFYRHEAREQENNTQQFFLQAGGRHLNAIVNIDYSVSWSQSNVDSRSYLFPFNRTGVNYDIDMDDRDRPQMTITNQQFVLDDGSIDRRFITLGNVNRFYDNHVDNNYSAKLDLKFPFSLGSIKAGSSYQIRSKSGEYDELYLTYMRSPIMTRFSMLQQRDVQLMEDYTMPWLVHTEHARFFYNTRRPLFTMDEEMNRQNSDIWNYESMESILAGYGMATFNIDRFSLLAGARIEYTDAEYEGRSVLFQRINGLDPTSVTESSNDYVHILPHAQLRVDLNEKTNLHLAYSNTLGRPDYNSLSPFELINVQDTTVFRGNPGLVPVESQNFDLFINRLTNNFGQIEAGLFYKRINNLIAARERVINVTEGDMPSFDTILDDETASIPVRELSFVNVDEAATLYGFEVSYQQRFAFLPGFLSNFGTYVNYTWTESVNESLREEDVAFPHQSPHVVNVALSYTQGRYFAQLAYYWADDYIYEYGNEQQIPAVHSAESVYMDQIQSGWSDLYFTFRFRLSQNFRFWADAYNFMGSNHVTYQYERDIYPVLLENRGGFGIRAGIRYDL